MRQAPVAVLVSLALSAPAAARADSVASVSIEIEEMAGAARASAGTVMRQPMDRFGAGWGGNAQLFWAAAAPAERPLRSFPHLDFSFVVPAAGTYDVVLHHTVAPDFGTFRVFLDGQPAADVDGYGPAVAPRAVGLGTRTLRSGRHAVVVTVVGKAAGSRGYAVGLDRLELRSQADSQAAGLAGTIANIYSHDRNGNRPQRNRGPSLAAPELSFASVSSITQKWTEKAGPDASFQRPSLVAHLVWDPPPADGTEWRWQAARQPFGGEVTLAPPGLAGEDSVGSRTFAIDLAQVLGEGRKTMKSPGSRNRTIDVYIRLLPTRGGQPAGQPSNVVVAHVLPGLDTAAGEADALARDRANTVRNGALAALTNAYRVEVLGFTPAVFTDPEMWGCVVVTRNPHVGLIGHPLALYPPRGKPYCGKPYAGQGHTPTFWDYVTGWAKAYDVAAGFYDDVKGWVASKFASALPCEAMGKAQADCEKYAAQLAGGAMSVGLAAAGVPPTLPDLDQAAKGHVVDVAVNATCSEIEAQGGQCSPQLRKGLAAAYGAGLDELEHKVTATTKQPGCEDAAVAHQNGREPLPCFGNYPGVEFRPAPGAVYQPPMVKVRLTRKDPGPVIPPPGCELYASLPLRNHFPGGTIETYYPPAPPTQLSGEPFAPARLALPALALGRSMDLTFPMGGIRTDAGRFSSTSDGHYTVHNGWCYLYEGGTGTLNVSVGRCGDPDTLEVSIPRGRNCTQ